MVSKKYAKYYKSTPVGDFQKLYPQLTAPSFHIWGREWNSGYRMDWFCVTEPFLMINEPHTHAFDQFLAFQNAKAYLFHGQRADGAVCPRTRGQDQAGHERGKPRAARGEEEQETLKQTGPFQAGVAPAADDYVVEHLDTDNRPG